MLNHHEPWWTIIINSFFISTTKNLQHHPSSSDGCVPTSRQKNIPPESPRRVETCPVPRCCYIPAWPEQSAWIASCLDLLFQPLKKHQGSTDETCRARGLVRTNVVGRGAGEEDVHNCRMAIFQTIGHSEISSMFFFVVYHPETLWN